MMKLLPPVAMSEKDSFHIQWYDWLNKSHYWNPINNGLYQCKWCEMIMPNELERSILCKNNPEILKIKTNEFS
jgi:hypothetical protein